MDNEINNETDNTDNKKVTVLKFEDLKFQKIGNKIKAIFQRLYYFSIDEEELEKIGKFSVEDGYLKFYAPEKKVQNKFNRILQKGFNNLVSFNNKKTIYIDENSGIPLIGTNIFGIVDRDTNIIEIKPMTGCNLNCLFCSVDEGISSKKTMDFLVEEDYLVEEFKKIAKLKKNKLEAHIGGQCEPTLYPKIYGLIKDLKKLEQVKDVTIDTNGIFLDEKKIDRMIDAGLTRINLSFNAVDEGIAKKLAGADYNVKKIMELARYIKKRINLIIAPVLIRGINDEEIEKLILFSKELECPIGIQNCLLYKRGRKNFKELKMLDFFKRIEFWEKKYCVDLKLKSEFDILDDKVLQKPFQKGQIVAAEVMCPGKYINEYICAAYDRAIVLLSKKDLSIGSMVKVKIVRDKHNVFSAV